MIELIPSEQYACFRIKRGHQTIGFMPWGILQVCVTDYTSEVKYTSMESICNELVQVTKDRNWYRDKCNYLEQKLKEKGN